MGINRYITCVVLVLWYNNIMSATPHDQPTNEKPIPSLTDGADSPNALTAVDTERDATHISALDIVQPVQDPMVETAIQRLHEDREASKARKKNVTIERLSPQDNHFYVIRNDPVTGKEIAREKYTIKVLEGPDDPVFAPTYKLMQERFGENELDPEDIMKGQMVGLRKGFESMGTRAQIISIQNEKGEVVCTLDGGLLPLLDEDGKETGESIFMVFYVATDPKVEGIGIGREIMITAYQAAEQEARRRGLRFIGTAGECTYTSKRYWENLGWRRTYTQDQQGSIAEIPYVQPPLDFDLETGEITEGCGDAPEHFMVRLFDNASIEDPSIAEKFIQIVRAFYRANNYVDRRAFEAETAYQNHHTAIDPHLAQFSRDARRGNIRLLSGEECDALQRSGIEIEHYLTPDELAEAAGTENL